MCLNKILYLKSTGTQTVTIGDDDDVIQNKRRALEDLVRKAQEDFHAILRSALDTKLKDLLNLVKRGGSTDEEGLC